ncbi:MAG: Stk1 family PASTA domain-containing Ser/Thr kinase [Oscillospiraceae bacterium]|nr:Stk1 family PASTA domain-containing Ser/Thr kinase [Oscillospiraceae bacterium]
MDRFIGMKLDGRYEIVELIGVGGMADVYKAIDIMENRVVAVKILKSEFSENEDFVRRFRNESKAIAVLSHPNIVKIFDVGYENDMQYIVMEHIDGITLKEYIEQQGLLKWRDCVHFTIQILRALQLAHDRGIVHRDIKPQNVMLMSDGSIKVMDFGIARFSRQNSNTLSEKTMGSVHYVSPEQARGARTDEKSDIYSVGVMMYEMLTGRKPFDGDTPVSVALKHMNEEPPKPTTYVSSLYAGLEEIILHAMEKDASKRYQSASEMIRDIESFKIDQSITFGYADSEIEKSASAAGVLGGIKSISDKLPKFKKKPKKEKAVKEEPVIIQDEYYDEYDEEDEDDYEPRHNFILPILAAVTVTVIIVATLFVANVILGAFKTAPSSSNDYVMPKLIGKNYYDARAEYTDIQLIASEEFNSEYEAGIIVFQEKAEGRIVKIGDTIKVTVSKGTRMVSVPDVIDYHYNSAYAALTAEDLMVMRIEKESDDIAAGYVISTEPAAGATVEENTTVRVYVSLGPSTEDTIVPDVLNLPVSEAEEKIVEAYLEPKIQYVESSEPEGTVISQNIVAGDTVTRSTVVTIYVSDGSGIVSDPFEELPGVDIPDVDFPGIGDDIGTNEYGERQVVIDIDIPSTARSSYYLSFIDQETMETVAEQMYITVTNAGKTVSTIVSGTGNASIIVEVTSLNTDYKTTLAIYEVDFTTGTYYRTDYFSAAFSLVDMQF